ncbi:MAG: maltose acetyltransferase [Clostridiales bacterium]|nr:MAG: maltose acetyltransferase [Clostridiales bacterium]
MTEKEKMEKGFLYMPSGDLVKHRYNIQDAVFEYNKIPPSHYAERATAIKKILGKTGKKIDILPPFKCDYGYHIEVGENFFANYNFIVLDGNMVKIGDNVLIAPNVSIYAAGHPFDTEERIQGLEYAFPVTIGDNVWIGGSTTIIGGVTIGKNTVIGAGSVVLRDISEGVLAAGNPCRVIRQITEQDKLKYQRAD